MKGQDFSQLLTVHLRVCLPFGGETVVKIRLVELTQKDVTTLFLDVTMLVSA